MAKWNNGARLNLERGGMTPPWIRATCRPSKKRGHVRALQISRVGGFSRNLRKEVTKSLRYYFVDNGIRNAVIAQFQPLRLQPDIRALWENFIVNERRRKLDYARVRRKDYFWRTYDQQEMDRVEVDEDGN